VGIRGDEPLDMLPATNGWDINGVTIEILPGVAQSYSDREALTERVLLA
jgi:hypothetical protein